MDDLTLKALVAAATVAPFVVGYGLARFVRRRRIRRELRRPWSLAGEYQRLAHEGRLEPNAAPSLPEGLPPVVILYEWAMADLDRVYDWRIPSCEAATSVQGWVEAIWRSVPPANQQEARERLQSAVTVAGTWWGGAEAGWNGRPLVLPVGEVAKKQKDLPILPSEDLSAAPAFKPFASGQIAKDVDPPSLIILLAATRRARGSFERMLQTQGNPLLEQLSTRVGTDVGRRLGAGIGGVFGPIGSMVGQYLGELAGKAGAGAVTREALPAPVTQALQSTQQALAALGDCLRASELAAAADQPAELILAFGRSLERQRARRSRRLSERLWPSIGLVAAEECLRVAAGELRAQRGAAEHLKAVVGKADPSVAGAILLQNPWLARGLPDGPRRLSEARAALNRVVLTLRGR